MRFALTMFLIAVVFVGVAYAETNKLVRMTACLDGSMEQDSMIYYPNVGSGVIARSGWCQDEATSQETPLGRADRVYYRDRWYRAVKHANGDWIYSAEDGSGHWIAFTPGASGGTYTAGKNGTWHESGTYSTGP